MVVRVYDVTRIEPKVIARALDVASSALAPAVTIAWARCVGSAGEGACAIPDPKALILRVVEPSSLPAESGNLALGDAYLDEHGHGSLATVYADRIRVLSDAAGGDFVTLVGYAIAHELGHLLMASTEHGPTGLMRRFWSPEEILAGRHEDWAFSAADIARMRDNSRHPSVFSHHRVRGASSSLPGPASQP